MKEIQHCPVSAGVPKALCHSGGISVRQAGPQAPLGPHDTRGKHLCRRVGLRKGSTLMGKPLAAAPAPTTMAVSLKNCRRVILLWSDISVLLSHRLLGEASNQRFWQGLWLIEPW